MGGACATTKGQSRRPRLAGSGRSCPSATGSWQSFAPVVDTTAASGGSLEVYVEQSGAVAGDSVDLDGVSVKPA